MNTDCLKCGAPMTPPPKPYDGLGVQFVVTAYLCKQCGHWNNLKARGLKKPRGDNNAKRKRQ